MSEDRELKVRAFNGMSADRRGGKIAVHGKKVVEKTPKKKAPEKDK